MRPRLLDIIACPECRSKLACEAAATDPASSHIMEGRLLCGNCDKTYPIRKGVPYFADTPETIAHAETMDKFGYEWTRFSDYSVDNFAEFIKPLPQGYFSGKLGLDAGCGAGRHALRAAALGAEIVGLDISKAVDAAFAAVRNNAKIHIVQGNIALPPFSGKTFDFIYSLGVLQHMPEPEKGYHSLVSLLKEKRDIFIWVYQKRLRKILLEIPRAFTRAMPASGIRLAALAATMIDYGIFCTLFRVFNSLPAAGAAARKMFPARTQEYAGYSFRNNWTDWYDRLAAPLTNYYTVEDIEKWLKNAGLEDGGVSPVGDSWIWAKGTRGAGGTIC